MMRRILAGVLATAAVTFGLVAVSPGPAMAAGGWKITNYNSGRCVAPQNNSTDRNVRLVQSNIPCPTTWNFTAGPDAGYKVIKLDANSARCMVPSGSSTVKNAAVVSGGCATSPFFEWYPLYVATLGGRDYYALENGGSGLCLAVVGDSTAAGASILQAPCEGTVTVGQLFTW
jgi:ricin-type beta-trefoil lectin protein